MVFLHKKHRFYCHCQKNDIYFNLKGNPQYIVDGIYENANYRGLCLKGREIGHEV